MHLATRTDHRLPSNQSTQTISKSDKPGQRQTPSRPPSRATRLASPRLDAAAMRAPLLCLLAVAALPAATAQQASNFNVSLETAEAYQCGETCYEILQSTRADDLAIMGSDFDWDFYAVAANFSTANFSTAKPGDLLKLKPVNPTTLTTLSGVSVYRIQYVSEDLDGTYVPVTGYIALPYAVPESGKFPLVAFAHGTIGMYPGCAISNGPDLFDYNSWSLLTERGYALVGTDYAGLGTNATDHKYVALPAHAQDLFHSVTAARQAFGSVLTDKWMSVGHSQGGGAVWRLAEDVDRLAEKHAYSCGSELASDYIGTVALAPVTKAWDLAKLTIEKYGQDPDFHSYSVFSLLPLLSVAIKRVYPSFNSSILGDVMSTRMGLAEEAQLCASGTLGLTLDLTIEELTTMTTTDGVTPEDVQIAEAFQNTTGVPSGVVAHGPVLVVQGVNDTTILEEVTEQAWETACGFGSEIHLLLYPKQDHSGVLTAAAPEWLKWVDSRFNGEATAGQCSKVTRQPFDYEYVRAEPELDLSTNTVN